MKAALLDAEKGTSAGVAFSPEKEMRIDSPHTGWAEQDPESWWEELVKATRKLQQQVGFAEDSVIGIGISYQMHGLVCVDEQGKVLRPAIIWCDSRAVKIGAQAFDALGHDYCLEHYLNSPGNFTASKLKWVRDNEPAIYDRIDKVMLPGDYIAYRLTGRIATTVSGLSEGICWDYKARTYAEKLFSYYGFDRSIFPGLVPTFGEQGRLSARAAGELKISAGTPVTYRAGDQPNNAYSLNVLEPGEVATTAGTSGVIYGVTSHAEPDALSRVNTFVHVNNTPAKPRNGILLCINGTGCAYSWIRKNMDFQGYQEMNELAAAAPAGANGLMFFPFGNGAERVLQSRNTGARLLGLDFNIHGRQEIARVVQEGVAFALRYGLEVMEQMDMSPGVFKAGNANMFLSPVFRQVFSNITGAAVEIYDTDGAQGAARASGVGAGYYAGYAESFRGLTKLMQVDPDKTVANEYRMMYLRWKDNLKKFLDI